MKFYNYDIVFQEIPDEVTLAINISHCPNHCQGCHSPHLWEDVGEELTIQQIEDMIKQYYRLITCVCFMGGDQDVDYIEYLSQYIRTHTSLKIGWYSGRCDFPPHPERFDYIKTGPYFPHKGGLSSPTTNQRIYQYRENVWVDITERMKKRASF